MRAAQIASLVWCSVSVIAIVSNVAAQQTSRDAAQPGSRVLMDAHNCYPYGEWWYDRMDRALSAGTPLAIEQDLTWYTDPRTGKSWPVLSHDREANGHEPTMREYFFERVRPIVEKALRDGDRSEWPLITLNLDFKSEEPALLRAVWDMLTDYKDWITTAPRAVDRPRLQPLDVKPILVLTGESDAQQAVFYDTVPVGGQLLVFGAVHTNTRDPLAPPGVIESAVADNYRRWWNNSWVVVESGGSGQAGAWTAAKNARLQQLVAHAHQNHLWIRFYTLDGAAPAELSSHGWFRSYNFGSRLAVQTRWIAAARAGVDYIASDQYEDLGAYLKARALVSANRQGSSQ